MLKRHRVIPFDSFTTFLRFLIFQDKRLENMLDDFWFEDGSIKVAFPSSWKSSKINKKKNKQLKFHFQKRNWEISKIQYHKTGRRTSQKKKKNKEGGAKEQEKQMADEGHSPEE